MIKAEEARKERIRQERIQAEFGRVQAIQEAIAEIGMGAMSATGKTSAQIAALLEETRAAVPGAEVFQEMLPQAQQAHAAAIGKLEMAHKAALHTEAEAAKLAAEREELALLRKQAAEQRAKDEAAAKIEQQKRAEEQARIAAEQKAQADALAEQQRQMAEREAAMAKREADAKAAQEKAEREAAEKLAAEQEAARIAALPKPEPVAAVVTAPVEPEALAEAPSAAVETASLPTMRLGQIKESIAPFSITAEGLEQLGFPPAARERGSCLYHFADYSRMQAAFVAHMQKAGFIPF